MLAEVTTLLGQDLDWDYVTRMAELNEITPLVVHTLRMCDPDLIPSCLSGRLDAQFYDNVARNLTLSSTLTALLDALAAQGIAAVPLKGPALAVMAYGDLSSRTFCDLDILVRRRDVERAEALLGRHGYRRRLDLAGLRDVAYRHSETAYDLVREDAGDRRDSLGVDAEVSRLPDGSGTGSAAPGQTLLEATVSSLAVEDLLLYLCVHATKHRWERLKWLCDIAELLRARQDIDWAAIIERADPAGRATDASAGPDARIRRPRCSVPNHVQAWVRSDPAVDPLAGCAEQRLRDRPRIAGPGQPVLPSGHDLAHTAAPVRRPPPDGPDARGP